MHDSRRRAEWECASALLAMIHNCAFGVKHPVSPDELNPYAQKKRSVSSDFVASLFGNAGRSANHHGGDQKAEGNKADSKRGDDS